MIGQCNGSGKLRLGQDVRFAHPAMINYKVYVRNWKILRITSSLY